MADLTLNEFNYLSEEGLKLALRHEAKELHGFIVSSRARGIRVDPPFFLEKQAFKQGGLFFYFYCLWHRLRRIALNLLNHPFRYRESIIRAR